MSLRRSIERLGPYPSLFLLALPTATVEPLKLVAVAVAGKGHWISGTVMIVACYAFSLLVLERLFVIVKSKLLTIPWFAKLWKSFVSVRTRALRLVGNLVGLRRIGALSQSASSSERVVRSGQPHLDRRLAGAMDRGPLESKPLSK
jgi:hypothetical protein